MNKITQTQFPKVNPCDMVFQFINEDVACQHNCDCVFSFLDDVLLVSNQTSIYLRASPAPPVQSQPSAASLFTNFSLARYNGWENGIDNC